jgi:inorganic pyrophosphatase
MDDTDFWSRLDRFVAERTLIVDRPRGAAHPRYPLFTYPMDYGYLAGTHASDGAEIDVWIGTQLERRVTGVVCTVDLEKIEVEVKVLYGCTSVEADAILAIHNRGSQSAVLIRRPEVNCDPPQESDRPAHGSHSLQQLQPRTDR